MSEGGRHELKFVLDHGRLAVAERWLYRETDLRRSYQSRWVNSLYFDDTCFTAVRDNLAGISDRRKVRLRWYHGEEERDPSRPVLEIKSRKNRFGRKESFEVAGLQDRFLELASDQLMLEIEKELAGPEEGARCFDDFLVPSLHVSYQRDYFESEDGVRATFDRNIHFRMPVPDVGILDGPFMAYPNIVMEVKFPGERAGDVGRILRNLPLSVKRHSKYLSGLAAFGYVLYN